MLTHLYTGGTRTGHVPVSIDLYADDGEGDIGEVAVAGAEGTPDVLSLVSGSNRLRVNRIDSAYGHTLYGTRATIEVKGDTADLAERFAEEFDEAAYLWRIAWPEHELDGGGTVPPGICYLRTLSGALRRTMARKVYAGGNLTLELYDGIAALRDIKAPGLRSFESVSHWAAELLGTVNRHLPPVWAGDVIAVHDDDIPNSVVPSDPNRLRFLKETHDDRRRGDFGTRYEQVESVAGGFGLVVFQQTAIATAPTHAQSPSIWCVHRNFVGRQIGESGTSRANWGLPVLSAATWLPGHTVALTESDYEADDRSIDPVPPIRSIVLTGPGDGELVWPGFPDPDGIFPQEIILADVVPTEDVFARMTLIWGGSGDSGATLRLYGTTEMWELQADGSWDTTPSVLGESQSLYTRTADEFPEAGQLAIEVMGPQVEASVTFVDPSGDLVTDWIVTIPGASYGEEIEIRRLPEMEVRPQGTWEEIEGWTSPLYDTDYRTIGQYQAANRIAQQGRALAAPRGNVSGLIGPGVRLRLDAAIFDRGLDAIIGGGLDMDLDEGWTAGAWVETIPPEPEPSEE